MSYPDKSCRTQWYLVLRVTVDGPYDHLTFQPFPDDEFDLVDSFVDYVGSEPHYKLQAYNLCPEGLESAVDVFAEMLSGCRGIGSIQPCLNDYDFEDMMKTLSCPKCNSEVEPENVFWENFSDNNDELNWGCRGHE